MAKCVGERRRKVDIRRKPREVCKTYERSLVKL
jgi:hypothetical protein